jgi:hypothetical protein
MGLVASFPAALTWGVYGGFFTSGSLVAAYIVYRFRQHPDAALPLPVVPRAVVQGERDAGGAAALGPGSARSAPAALVANPLVSAASAAPLPPSAMASNPLAAGRLAQLRQGGRDDPSAVVELRARSEPGARPSVLVAVAGAKRASAAAQQYASPARSAPRLYPSQLALGGTSVTASALSPPTAGSFPSGGGVPRSAARANGGVSQGRPPAASDAPSLYASSLQWPSNLTHLDSDAAREKPQSLA